METTVVKSTDKVSVSVKIKKEDLKEYAPQKDNMVLIHEMYQCNVCYRIFNEIENLASHACISKSPIKTIQSNTSNCDLENDTSTFQSDHNGSNDKPCLSDSNQTNDSNVEPGEVKKILNYTCHLCFKSFLSKQSLMVHKQCHQKCYKCVECGLVFQGSELLKEHRKTQHPKIIQKKYYLCEFCEERFTAKKKLFAHLKNVHKFASPESVLENVNNECYACKQQFPTKKHLKKHKWYECAERLYKCDRCGKHYMFGVMLDRHYEEVHVKKSRYCKICDKDFEFAPGSFKKHLELHAPVKPYACATCHKTFSRKDYLKNHQVTHLVHRPFGCDFCDKKFKTEAHLRSHLFSHRKGEDYTGSQNTTKVYPKNAKHVCNECGKAFYCPSFLKVHYRIHTGERPFKCNQCHKAFRSKDFLKNHARVHSNQRYVCTICKSFYVNEYSLKKHMNVHRDDKCHVCNECGRRFSDQSSLRVHYVVHTKEKPFQCDVCFRSYSQKGTLSKHKRLHHDAKKLDGYDMFVARYNHNE